MPVTASPEALQHVPCIRYPVQFQANQVGALIDSGSKVNVMTSAFIVQLGLSIRATGIGVQKIVGFALKMYSMIITGFSIQDNIGKIRFFKETFLLADTSIEVVLGLFFLALSNTDIQFDTESFTQRSYNTAEALSTSRRGELIDEYKFAKAALEENSETFVVHGADLEVLELAIHPSWTPLLAALQQDKAPTKILPEYPDYADVFSPDLVIELTKNTGISEHAIELVQDKQPSYGPIYSVGLMELETLKVYMETTLKSGFIQSSKSPTEAPLFFDKKSDGSLYSL